MLPLLLSFALAGELFPPPWQTRPDGAIVVPAEPDALVPRDPTIQYGALPNGLTWVVRESNQPSDRVELRMLVRVGSAQESEAERGVAHFVEHLAFNGTTSFPGTAVIDTLQQMGMRFGADQNAATTFNSTVYRLTIPVGDGVDPAANLSTGLKILAEQASGLLFDSAECEKEAGVVMEEWRRTTGAAADFSTQITSMLLARSRYVDRLPVGDTDDVEHDLTCEAARRFWRRWYRPENITVLAVGDLPSDTLKVGIERAFAAIPGRGGPTARDYEVPAPKGLTFSYASNPNTPSSTWGWVVRADQAITPRTMADLREDGAATVAIVATILRLVPIIQQPDSPIAGISPGGGQIVARCSVVELDVAAREGKELEALELFWTELERIRQHGFREDEITRALDAIRSQTIAGAARIGSLKSSTRVDAYVRSLANRTTLSPAAELQAAAIDQYLPAFTPAEILQVWTDRVAPPDGRVILIGRTETAPVSLDEARAAVDRARAQTLAAPDAVEARRELVPSPPTPTPIPPGVFDAPTDTTRWELPNGARVILRPSNAEPGIVHVEARSAGGSWRYPVEARATAAMADEVRTVSGLGELTPPQLIDVVIGHTIDLKTTINTENELITGKFGTPDARLWMQLLYLLHTAPRFDAAALQRVHLSRTERARHRLEDPAKRFADAANAILFEPSPSVGPIEEAEYAAVKLDDVARIFRERFSDPGEFDYVFVGDITPEALQGLLEAWIAPIPGGGAKREAAGDRGMRRARAPASVALTDGDGQKASLEWSWFGFGDSVALERTALDAVAWVLEERLRARLREQLGGTYDVDVGDAWDELPEPFLRAQVSFQCDPTRLAELETALTEEVAKLADGGVSAAELELWREQRVTRDTQGRKTNPWWLSSLGGVLARNDEVGSVFDVRARIDALQAADVDAVARRVLRSASVYKVTQRPPG